MKEKLIAQVSVPGGRQISAPTGVPTAGDGALAGMISWVIIALSSIGVIAALIFLIWGGVKWITSGGDREKLDSARRTVIFSVIGLIIIILSVVIIAVIDDLLGFNLAQ